MLESLEVALAGGHRFSWHINYEENLLSVPSWRYVYKRCSIFLKFVQTQAVNVCIRMWIEFWLGSFLKMMLEAFFLFSYESCVLFVGRQWQCIRGVLCRPCLISFSNMCLCRQTVSVVTESANSVFVNLHHDGLNHHYPRQMQVCYEFLRDLCAHMLFFFDDWNSSLKHVTHSIFYLRPIPVLKSHKNPALRHSRYFDIAMVQCLHEAVLVCFRSNEICSRKSATQWPTDLSRYFRILRYDIRAPL